MSQSYWRKWYSGGLENKYKLLELEKDDMSKFKFPKK